jgi:hypothetical protein
MNIRCNHPVVHLDPRSNQYQLNLMPVIRYPNFSDPTADIRLDISYWWAMRTTDTAPVSLREYLGNFATTCTRRIP